MYVAKTAKIYCFGKIRTKDRMMAGGGKAKDSGFYRNFGSH